MNVALALTTTEIQNFAFDWYPVFGVVFMAMLLLVFFKLMRARWARPSRRR